MANIEPPFEETYRVLFQKSTLKGKDKNHSMVDKECELPLVDLDQLNFWCLDNEYDHSNNFQELDKCIKEMAEAASEWGFFQVVNHGIPRKVLDSMKYEQMKMFHQPFRNKSQENFMNLSADSYRWGNPTATCLRQFSWSEAFHIALTDISKLDECNSTRSAVGLFATRAASLARRLAECLGQNLGVKSSYFQENCLPSSSYVRMNRYPPCPSSLEVHGLMPHTDSDFLTILYQDQVGGLQLMKDGKWLNVKPKPEVLIVNIGDLFQALSNGVYKSIEHRVVARQKVERFSVAYFYCPSHEAVIESYSQPAVYKKFSFSEYRQQIHKDVQATGDKMMLITKKKVIQSVEINDNTEPELVVGSGVFIFQYDEAPFPQTFPDSTPVFKLKYWEDILTFVHVKMTMNELTLNVCSRAMALSVIAQAHPTSILL